MPTNSTGTLSISGWTGGITWHVDPVDLAKTVVADALRDTAEWLLGEANRTVPHQEGTLQDSGATDYAELFGVQVASVFYGGEASAYAVRRSVRKRTGLNHLSLSTKFISAPG